MEEKACVVCGRRIEWRKKWARDWDGVRFCSDACRRHGVTADDERLEDAIRTLLVGRRTMISPSDAAQAVFPDDWREHEEDARRAARRLVARGECEIVQAGRVVDPSSAKGVISIRRV